MRKNGKRVRKGGGREIYCQFQPAVAVPTDLKRHEGRDGTDALHQSLPFR